MPDNEPPEVHGRLTQEPDQAIAAPRQPPLAQVDAFQQRHRVVGLPLGVIYKYVDDSGGNLAALITYFAFVSLFPLLLLASTVLGLVLQGHADLQQRLLDSALTQLPVVGGDLGRPKQIGGGAAGLVIGGLGALYGGMGVAQSVQNACNAAWTVPRNQRPNPFAARGRSIVLLLVIGADVVGTSVVAGLVGAAPFIGRAAGVAVFVGTFVVHGLVFAFVFRFATAAEVSWRQVAPGAAAASAGWLGLQYVGVAYVGRTVNHASTTNGVFAVVLGLLAFLYVTSIVLVFCIELNVVLAERLWPRTLLTPFTDNVVLTEADRQSYSDLATAQQLKGFQRVDVDFDPSPVEQANNESTLVADQSNHPD